MKIVISEDVAEEVHSLLDGHDISDVSFESAGFADELRDAEVLIVRTYTKVGDELLKKAPKLKYVIRCGVGLENIEMDACESHGIKVINAPGSNADSVAEHVVMMMLASKRNLVNLDRKTREGKWRESFFGSELAGKTVGLVGFGNIGKKVAERLQGFGVNIISYEIYKDRETAEKLGVKFVELQELLEKSDIVSIHVPLMKETFHMINRDRISQMKNGAIIINTARGAIVDEDALIEALGSGKISFAALDVFKNEPLEKSELQLMENVILTPHVAGVTEESFKRMCVQPVKQFLEEVKG